MADTTPVEPWCSSCNALREQLRDIDRSLDAAIPGGDTRWDGGERVQMTTLGRVNLLLQAYGGLSRTETSLQRFSRDTFPDLDTDDWDTFFNHVHERLRWTKLYEEQGVEGLHEALADMEAKIRRLTDSLRDAKPVLLRAAGKMDWHGEDVEECEPDLYINFTDKERQEIKAAFHADAATLRALAEMEGEE